MSHKAADEVHVAAETVQLSILGMSREVAFAHLGLLGLPRCAVRRSG
jgi:hypothetical protein